MLQTIVSGLTVAILVSISKFRTLRWRNLRMIAFLLFGTSALISLLHGFCLYGYHYMFGYMGMKWYLVELSLYGSGILIFAVSLQTP